MSEVVYSPQKRSFLEKALIPVLCLLGIDQLTGGKYTNSFLEGAEETLRSTGLEGAADAVEGFREGVNDAREKVKQKVEETVDVTQNYIDQKINEGKDEFMRWAKSYFDPPILFLKSLFQLTHIFGDVVSYLGNTVKWYVSLLDVFPNLVKKGLAAFDVQLDWVEKAHNILWGLKQTAKAGMVDNFAHIKHDWTSVGKAFDGMYATFGIMSEEAQKQLANANKEIALLSPKSKSWGVVYADAESGLTEEDAKKARNYGKALAAAEVLKVLNANIDYLTPQADSYNRKVLGFVYTLCTHLWTIADTYKDKTVTFIDEVMPYLENENFNRFANAALQIATGHGVNDAKPFVNLLKKYLNSIKEAHNNKEHGLNAVQRYVKDAAKQDPQLGNFFVAGNPLNGLNNLNTYLKNGITKCENSSSNQKEPKPGYRIVIVKDEDGKVIRKPTRLDAGQSLPGNPPTSNSTPTPEGPPSKTPSPGKKDGGGRPDTSQIRPGAPIGRRDFLRSAARS